jgi:hypothetical protein
LSYKNTFAFTFCPTKQEARPVIFLMESFFFFFGGGVAFRVGRSLHVIHFLWQDRTSHRPKQVRETTTNPPRTPRRVCSCPRLIHYPPPTRATCIYIYIFFPPPPFSLRGVRRLVHHRLLRRSVYVSPASRPRVIILPSFRSRCRVARSLCTHHSLTAHLSPPLSLLYSSFTLPHDQPRLAHA